MDQSYLSSNLIDVVVIYGQLIDQCLNSLKERFVMSQASFTVKVITKNGIETIRKAEVPKGY